MNKPKFKRNRFLGFISMFLLDYNRAYKKGLYDGMRKVDYYKGYADGVADGVEETHNFYKENAILKLKKNENCNTD